MPQDYSLKIIFHFGKLSSPRETTHDILNPCKQGSDFTGSDQFGQTDSSDDRLGANQFAPTIRSAQPLAPVLYLLLS